MVNKKSVYFIQLGYNKLYKINLKTIDRDIIADMVQFYECRNITICN